MDAHLFISNGEAHRFSIDEMFKYLQKFDLRINGLQAHFGVLAMMYRVLLKLNSPRVTAGTECTGERIQVIIKHFIYAVKYIWDITV